MSSQRHQARSVPLPAVSWHALRVEMCCFVLVLGRVVENKTLTAPFNSSKSRKSGATCPRSPLTGARQVLFLPSEPLLREFGADFSLP